MRAAIVAAQSDGKEGVAFGDLFQADVRQYRERMMARTGITPLFPLWGDPQPNGVCTLCRNNLVQI
jgi:diphthamide synthase (EF-2-diphthine--ammonia ligase)